MRFPRLTHAGRKLPFPKAWKVQGFVYCERRGDDDPDVRDDAEQKQMLHFGESSFLHERKREA